MCGMQALGFFIPPHPHAKPDLSRGFTLVELLVCISLLAVLAAFAIPSWQRLLERSRVEATRDQLMNDLQAARLRALQRGEALQFTRLRDCTWATTASTDWSCGWQLVLKADQTVLQSTPQLTPLQITFAKTTPLDISPRGDLGTVGERWVIKSQQAALNVSNVLCLSSAGRARWQVGETCSN
jgi:prepilin-type N-terminal cleavage/methylation domain-containing protein